MKRFSGNTLLGCLFGLAAIFGLIITNLTINAKSIMGDPGPILFPNLVCGAVFVLAVLIVIDSLKNVTKPFEGVFQDPEKKEGILRMVLIIADLALFLVLWQYITFLPAGIIFMFLQCMIFKEKPIFSIIYSVSVTGVLYVMFAILLKVNLNM